MRRVMLTLWNFDVVKKPVVWQRLDEELMSWHTTARPRKMLMGGPTER